MATALIGLDVGTHAVRAVELALGRSRPVIRRMGQVALPPGAVVAGEVMDPAVVSAALRRLWREVGFTGRSVVVGVANQRVVARMTDFPALPEDELRSSLPFQVQDLIPIPVDEAELDFQIVDRFVTETGEERLRVLLVAAHRDMLRTLLSALEGAGLTAARVDLVPLALIRAVHDPSAWMHEDAPAGHEVIVGVGAGVTNVVVHEHGIPRFVRTLAMGGANVTDALSAELGIEGDEAEAVKRHRATGRIRADLGDVDGIVLGSVDPLVTEIAGSIDYHVGQAQGSELRRAIVTGGGSRLDMLAARLGEQLGTHVEQADPLAGLDIGNVGLHPEILAGAADLFTVAIGLAMSARAVENGARRISLLPPEITAQRAAKRQMVLAGAGLGVAALALVGLSYSRGTQVDAANADAARTEQQLAATQAKVAEFSAVEKMEQDIESQRQIVLATLENDVDWVTLMQDVTAILPNDVWITSFSGSAGAIQITAKGHDHTSTARWMLRADDLGSITGVWVPSSTKEPGAPVVSFTSSARLTPEANSNRAERFQAQESR